MTKIIKSQSKSNFNSNAKSNSNSKSFDYEVYLKQIGIRIEIGFRLRFDYFSHLISFSDRYCLF